MPVFLSSSEVVHVDHGCALAGVQDRKHVASEMLVWESGLREFLEVRAALGNQQLGLLGFW